MCNVAYTGKGLEPGTDNTYSTMDDGLNASMAAAASGLRAGSAAHLSSKPICCNSWQVLKGLEFAGGKALANYFHVLFLH